MPENNSAPTRRNVFKATGAAVTTAGLAGTASAITDPSDVEADLLASTETSGFDKPVK